LIHCLKFAELSKLEFAGAGLSIRCVWGDDLDLRHSYVKVDRFELSQPVEFRVANYCIWHGFMH